MGARVLIAGGGIGGLAAALALARAGHDLRLYEQAPHWSELGAGVQLGPNATRLFRAWGLEAALHGIAATPRQLNVRRMADNAELARLRLGQAIRRRYGAPYLTVHRGDLHAILLQAARAAGVELQLGRRIEQVDAVGRGVQARFADGSEASGDLLVAADGVWSRVRQLLLGDGPAQRTGHVACRALVPQADLPAPLRSRDVTVWLGPSAHVVAYPVRRGDWLNIVAIVAGEPSAPAEEWDQQADGEQLGRALRQVTPDLGRLLHAPGAWRQWQLHARPPLSGPGGMALGRTALLGDAAHPMLPYLAQGAAMALEDAAALAAALSGSKQPEPDVAAALQIYARSRWVRCARVQRRAERNGAIFHATGLVRWGRDLSLRLLGERLLDMPWLYGGRP